MPPSSQSTLAFLGALVLLLLVGGLTLASRHFLPIRTHSGEWVLTRIHERRWDQAPGGGKTRLRSYRVGADLIIRQDWDWDGDGSYDCREDDCPGRILMRGTACVFHGQRGQWVAAPPEVIQCEPGSPR